MIYPARIRSSGLLGSRAGKGPHQSGPWFSQRTESNCITYL